MNVLLSAALQYHARGWSVIPGHTLRDDGTTCTCGCSKLSCSSRGKHPRVTWTAYQEAAPSEAQIRTWWTSWPTANVLIITGRVSGLVVIDIDPRHGGDDSLASLGRLPDTLTAGTGGGGQHLYYSHPKTRVIKDGAGLLPGIDVRGDGGYVVAPPSVHNSGGRYTWDVGQPEEPVAIPPAIDRLLTDRTVGDVPPSSRRFDLEEIFSRGIKDGTRHSTLTQVAGHYAATGASYDMVLMSVLGVNARYCKPPIEDDREVVRIVDDIYRAEEEQRRFADAIAVRLEADGSAKDVIIPDERRAMARQLWEELGITGVTDWIVIRSDRIEYVLYTTDDEARLGDDLLNQGVVRKKLFNELGEILKPVENKSAWPKRAKMLRDLAREEVADSPVASDRMDEWLESYLATYPPIIAPTISDRRAALVSSAALEDGYIYIRPERLRQYLDMVTGERMTLSDLRKVMKRAGWHPQIVGVDGGTMRAWRQIYANGVPYREKNET